MDAELAEWNGGSGIGLRPWTSCSGTFRLAVGYAEYFWPEFDVVEGYIVRSGTTPECVRLWEETTGGDRRSAEATMNHMHLIDINYHDHGNLAADILVRLGSVLAEIHEAKLRWQFPDRPCTVRFFIPEDPTQFDGYQITFWQKAHETAAGGQITDAIRPQATQQPDHP